MSLVQLPGSPTDTTIKLQTRLGNDIPNSQSHEFSSYDANIFPDYKNSYKDTVFRTQANPIYNCHGMVFASRRTGIHDSRILQLILHDDGYTLVGKDSVLPGDIIIYFGSDGDFEHSGIVLCWNKQFAVPLVVSKWGRYSEVVHWGHNCPYDFANVRYYRVAKWT